MTVHPPVNSGGRARGSRPQTQQSHFAAMWAQGNADSWWSWFGKCHLESTCPPSGSEEGLSWDGHHALGILQTHHSVETMNAKGGGVKGMDSGALP